MRIGLFVAALLTLCCTRSIAQVTPGSGLTVSPSALQFRDHDIGTVTPADKTVVATNNGDASISLAIVLTGNAPSDFSWRSVCVDKIPAKGHCEITVLFTPTEPVVSTSPPAAPGRSSTQEARSALLEVKSGETSQEIKLTGNAFQNISALPANIEFGKQTQSTAGNLRSVRVTNHTDTLLSSVTATVTPEFSKDDSGCVNIQPAASCSIYITWLTTEAGQVTGAMAISGTLASQPAETKAVAAANTASTAAGAQNPSGAATQTQFRRLTRVIPLHGTVPVRPIASWFPSGTDWSFWLLVSISGLYFLGLVLVRWHMIAKPTRAETVAEIDAIQSRVIAETADLPGSSELTARLGQIQQLLDKAVYPFRHKNFSAEGGRHPDHEEPYPTLGTRLFNALFWTRGPELAGWKLAHEAELQLAALLPLERVRARLQTAEQELKDIGTPLALFLADRIRDALVSGEDLIQEHASQLLQQLMSFLKPLSVPEAARAVALADLQPRLSTCLQQLIDGLRNNAKTDADLDACKTRMTQFLEAANACQRLTDEIQQVISFPDIELELKGLLTQVANFIDQLAKKASNVQTQRADQALTIDTCNNSLADLQTLSDRAATLVDALKKAAVPDQGKAYQVLKDLCRSQAALIAAITQARAPNVKLLTDILDMFQRQTDPIAAFNQSAADSSTSDIANCRDAIWKLAALPPLSGDLMNRVKRALSYEVAAPLWHWRALLAEALSLIYDNSDTTFSQLVWWHNKLMWLVGCALLFILGIGLSFQNSVLLLAGAVGGLLSRLQRTIDASDAANDYGATWGALFLSPLTGALAAWGGILLISFGSKLNLLGSAVNLDWRDPYDPTSLAVALLFGFSERWFTGIVGQLETNLVKGPTAPSGAASMPKLAITSIDGKAVAGTKTALTVHGANFQPQAKATITDEGGKAIDATLQYENAATVVVTYTPTGTTAYSAILTVTNPDKQTATYKIGVTTAT